VTLPIANGAKSVGGRASYGFRPEHLTVADDGVAAKVIVIEPTGSETQVVVECGGQEIVCVFRERIAAAPGETLRIKPDPKLVHLFDETSGQRLN
jgi:multiple sugar transport system ATP-binding protein